MASWRAAAAGYVRFGDASAERFIAGRFDARHVAAYRRGHHPALRSDYFRLCYAWAEGGAYIDADEGYLGSGLPALLAGCRGLGLSPLVWARDEQRLAPRSEWRARADRVAAWNYYFANSPMIATSGHPAVAWALERATRLLLDAPEDARLDLHGTAGPTAITDAVFWTALQVGAGRAEAAPMTPVDWSSVADTDHRLLYKQDGRNWRQGEAIPLAAGEAPSSP